MRLEETDEMSLTTLTTMTTIIWICFLSRESSSEVENRVPHMLTWWIRSLPRGLKNSQYRQESGTCPLILWIQQALSAEFAIHWMSDRTCESFLSVFQRSLVDLGVDVVTTASTSWVCASDPVTRYLSHNSTSHPTKMQRCVRAFHLFCRGGDKRIGFIPAGVLLKISLFLLKNQSIYLQITFISLMRTKAN